MASYLGTWKSFKNFKNTRNNISALSKIKDSMDIKNLILNKQAYSCLWVGWGASGNDDCVSQDRSRPKKTLIYARNISAQP